MSEYFDAREGRALFGSDPRNYDEVRPPYPEPLYEFLVAAGALRAGTATLEIGAGTGLATRRLLELGARPLTVVEPDARFAPLLRSIADEHGVEMELIADSFEEASLPSHRYDLVAAATSFHWIQPSIGLAKVAEVLKPGGHAALWWHVFGDEERDDPFHQATRPILEPLLMGPLGGPGTSPFPLDTEARRADFAGTGQFEPPVYRDYRWTLVLNTAQVGALYATFSSITRLPAELRQRVLSQLMEVADQSFGGRVERNMITPIWIARKSSRQDAK